MKVQQELMRHASIQTTMNIYGAAMSDTKREVRIAPWSGWYSNLHGHLWTLVLRYMRENMKDAGGESGILSRCFRDVLQNQQHGAESRIWSWFERCCRSFM